MRPSLGRKLAGGQPAAALAGYEVVWRETMSLEWTEVIPVGDVTTEHVDLSKDNVVVGVRAVGRYGYRRPVAFPVPKRQLQLTG